MGRDISEYRDEVPIDSWEALLADKWTDGSFHNGQPLLYN
jgi:hypothetical protein